MRIEAVRGDITTQEVDAIVNAANSGLLGGGGVDGAIHRAAGPRLLQACRELRATSLPDGLPVGEAVATPGFDLPARWVIHTVGPNRHAGQTDPALLRAAFRSSLELAQELGCRSVAMPAISAGVYGWDADAVARAAVTETRALAARADTTSGVEVCGTDVVDAAAEQARGLELVRFVLFSDRLLRAFQAALDA
ncbi:MULTISPECIES: O-acetyl-ADP-ribose deacetylase [unclassified Actinomyces]|uniref:O-acetyl-ADP-ribose deacetylase n=1 Tax=unclassified Actinomyces TaxID=2609248 RepID=UPI000D59DD0C|nr:MULTISPECIES: O-acetyl-ADP-ribose deacetylase [unclassified Actinomyces]RAX19830.1 O-acetyl-ADP-ribose deacetylase [Actinomyces sp. Z5]RAX24218.1 O-acetyl-ADP-ribose deacetylase [Actinomyces sp. Z3]